MSWTEVWPGRITSREINRSRVYFWKRADHVNEMMSYQFQVYWVTIETRMVKKKNLKTWRPQEQVQSKPTPELVQV